MNRVYMKWKRETKDFFVESSASSKNLACVTSARSTATTSMQLIKNLEFAKQCDVPVLIHVLTKKGKGLDAAINSPEKFHGASPFDPDHRRKQQSRARHAAQLPGSFRPRARALRQGGSEHRRHHRRHAEPGPALSYLAQRMSATVFRRRHRRRTRGAVRRRTRDQGLSPGRARSTRRSSSAPTTRSSTTSALQNLPVTFCMDRAGLSRERRTDASRPFRYCRICVACRTPWSCSRATRTNSSTCCTRRCNTRRPLSFAIRAAPAQG